MSKNYFFVYIPYSIPAVVPPSIKPRIRENGVYEDKRKLTKRNILIACKDKIIQNPRFPIDKIKQDTLNNF